jgi:predicted nucleic acid-binding protein
MHYWDASAIVPLCVEERSSERLRELARHAEIVTWCLTPVEVGSAIERRAREGELDGTGRSAALENLRAIRDSWTEIVAVGAVVERSMRLLATRSLRAADVAQLAAALVACEDRPASHVFVCNDDRLTIAASLEGFASADRGR